LLRASCAPRTTVISDEQTANGTGNESTRHLLLVIPGRDLRHSISTKLLSYYFLGTSAIATARIGLAGVHTPSGVIPALEDDAHMSPHFTYLPLDSIIRARW